MVLVAYRSGRLYLYYVYIIQSALFLSRRSLLISIHRFFHINLVELTNTSGDHTFVPWEMIDYWHVVYADLTTCDNSATPLDDISFTIQFLNKDQQGKASRHFSYEEMGKYIYRKQKTLQNVLL